MKNPPHALMKKVSTPKKKLHLSQDCLKVLLLLSRCHAIRHPIFLQFFQAKAKQRIVLPVCWWFDLGWHGWLMTGYTMFYTYHICTIQHPIKKKNKSNRSTKNHHTVLGLGCKKISRWGELARMVPGIIEPKKALGIPWQNHILCEIAICEFRKVYLTRTYQYQTKHNMDHKKKLLLSIIYIYWLLNRDPYVMVYKIIPT